MQRPISIRAIHRGRHYASVDDVRAIAGPVRRHRVLTNFNAEADGISSDDIVRKLIDTVTTDSSDTMDGAMADRVFTTDEGSA